MLDNSVKLFIVGTMKAGTTSLQEYLGQHLDICATNIKETDYFTKNDNPSFKEYTSKYLPHYSGEAVIMESCPMYCINRDVASRIRKAVGPSKIVFVARNPSDRAYSHYLMQYSRGVEKRDFPTCVREEIELLKSGDRIKIDEWMNLPRISYLASGYYSDQLIRYMEHFGRDDILCITYENLKNNPTEVLNKICDLCHIDRDPNLNLDKQHNIYSEPIFPSLHRLLFTDNLVKRTIKFLFPSHRKNRSTFSYFITKTLFKINTRRGKKPNFDPAMRQQLQDFFEPWNQDFIRLFPHTKQEFE